MNLLTNNIIYTPKKYIKAAVIANVAGQEMITRLDWMALQPKRVIDVGCGVGDWSDTLKKRYPHATVLAIDHAFNMLQYAKIKAKGAVYLQADAYQLPIPHHSVDMIFANFFLPWQSDFVNLFKEWLRILTPNGLLMLTALGPDTLKEWARYIAPTKRPVLMDMHDLGDLLLQQGFVDPVLDVDYTLLTYQHHATLLQELLDSGMFFPNDASLIEDFSAVIANTPSENLNTTYEIIFAHAFAPSITMHSSDDESSVVKISLDDLRKNIKARK